MVHRLHAEEHGCAKHPLYPIKWLNRFSGSALLHAEDRVRRCQGTSEDSAAYDVDGTRTLRLFLFGLDAIVEILSDAP
jgi:hypothetical protein